MSTISSIHRAVEFIDANLQEDIALADIADAVFYSLYHFCRMFNAITHLTPYEYLMRRRLSESARELLATDKKIIEIAFDYQFNSPEVFARAFKRMFGMQPNQWRKQGQISQRTLLPKLSLRYLQHLNNGAYLKPMLEEKASISVAGLMTRVPHEPTIIAALWKTFAQHLPQNDLPPSPRYYGITYYPDDWEQCGYFYLAGRAIDTPACPNPTFVVQTLPASQYVRFTHKGRSQDISLTREYIYHTWLPKSGKRLAFPIEIEDYGPALSHTDTADAECTVSLPLA